MIQANTDLLLQFILAVAANQDDYKDRELGPIHFLKYVYLADLAHYSSTGNGFTGADWRFYKFGPWAQEVFDRVEPALLSIDANKKQIESKYSKDDFIRWQLPHPEVVDELNEQIPHVIAAAVKRAIHQFSNDTPSLLHHVYLTEPMLRAAPGEQLDFEILEKPKREPDKVAEESRTLSKTALRKRKEKLNQRKTEIRANLDKSKSSIDKPKKFTPPRYDEVFNVGVEWIDSLAGEDLEPLAGVVLFSSDIWKSPSRFDPDVS